MRRFLRKAFNSRRRQEDAGSLPMPIVVPPQPEEPENIQIILENGQPEGYSCWDYSSCPLCSRFRDRHFILQLFVTKYMKLGQIADLIRWTQGGGEGLRCPLSSYISLKFIHDASRPYMDPIPQDADFLVRIATRDTAVRGARKDEISTFEFEASWAFPHMKQRLVSMSCFVLSDEKLGHQITTRPANGLVNSPAAFAKANSWLEECNSKHWRCQRRLQSKLPTRVLLLSKSHDGDVSVRLRETSEEEEAPYVALSYVWGKLQTVRTLQSNAEDHMKSIDLTVLPKAIADAVHCTLELGLKYLWVDSLCIIQDSQEDKEREIGKMSSIYRDSYVTISAAMSNHCDEGFLEDRATTLSLMPTSFRLQVSAPKDPTTLNEWIEKYRGNTTEWMNFIWPTGADSPFENSPWARDAAWHDGECAVYLAGSPFVDEVGDCLSVPDIKEEPISKRGWTLQESWLPRRQLIYGSGQLTWRCKTCRRVDGGTQSGSYSWHDKSTYFVDENGDVFNEDDQKLDGEGRAFYLRMLWRDLVHEFSRRELTVPGDKLNAVEGIAQDLRQRSGYDFLAGLWKQDLVSELAWYQDLTRIDSEAVYWNRERTCPSWSWITVDGPVSHSHAENSSVEIQDAMVTDRKIVGTHPDQRLVVEGKITLRAPISTVPVIELLPYFKFLDENSSRQQFTNTLYLDGGLTSPYFEPTIRNGVPAIDVPPGMRFLELSWGKNDGSQNIAAESRGLVLAPVSDQPDTYRRVGFFVVALEYDVDWVMSGDNLVMMLSVEPGNVRPTEFGEAWKDQLQEEAVTII